jgi:L-serine dehydratase
MFLSTFDIFKIGIGPSSSHTMGPMVAAARFLDDLRHAELPQGTRLRASLHGSLAFTGKGHVTDRAVILGLLGFLPDTIDPDRAEAQEAALRAAGTIALPGLPVLAFNPDDDLIFDYGPPLPGHANGLVLTALRPDGEPLLSRTYYSAPPQSLPPTGHRMARHRPRVRQHRAIPSPSPRRPRCWPWAPPRAKASRR